MPSYYMVRAMTQSPEDFDVFFRKGVVAVGWSRVNFSSFEDVEELVNAVDQEYYAGSSISPQQLGKKKSQVRRFKILEPGDRIIVPYWSGIRLATVVAGEEFCAEDGDKFDLANQHKVEYLMSDGEIITVPRDQISEGLQRRLRLRGTSIADFNEFQGEIEMLFSGKTHLVSLSEEQEEYQRQFEVKLLSIICDGHSSLQAGGIGLERLVIELLEIDGYKADPFSKQAFQGFADADIKASKADFIASTDLLVQVKHHQGKTDDWGAQQLTEVIRTTGNEYEGHQLVLITSGNASEALKSTCEEEGIILIDGEGLVRWICESLATLKPETKRILRISELPTILE